MAERHTPRERLWLYRVGFRRGAGALTKPPDKAGDTDFEAGYSDGQKGLDEASRGRMAQLGLSEADVAAWVLRCL